VGITHILAIVYDPVSEFAIGIKAFVIAAGMSHKGTDMALIYGQRFFEHVLFLAILDPFGIGPFKTGKVIDPGCGPRTLLGIAGKRIRLIKSPSVGSLDKELVKITLFCACHKAGPDTSGTKFAKGLVPLSPAVKIPKYINLGGVRSIYAEINPFLTVDLTRVGPEFLIDLVVSTVGKQVFIGLGNEKRIHETSP